MARRARRPQVVPQLGDHPAADRGDGGPGARLARGALRRRRGAPAARGDSLGGLGVPRGNGNGSSRERWRGAAIPRGRMTRLVTPLKSVEGSTERFVARRGRARSASTITHAALEVTSRAPASRRFRRERAGERPPTPLRRRSCGGARGGRAPPGGRPPGGGAPRGGRAPAPPPRRPPAP